MSDPSPVSGTEEIAAYYARGREQDRFSSPLGRLEETRTRDILQRYLPAAPAVVLDIGGGPGAYAFWLAGQGYEVYLLDLAPLHIEQAEARIAAGAPTLASARVGDACALPYADARADAVLLLGPLYHLTEAEDRLRALREARRVLRPGGVLLAAGISRFASALDGLVHEFLRDPEFKSIVDADLRTGQHRNPEQRPGYFTTAYFHHPDELRGELAEAGLLHPEVLAVEGPVWLGGESQPLWNDPAHQATVLSLLRDLEREPSLLGCSAHLMAVGYKER